MITPRDVLRMQVDLRDRLENPVGPLGKWVASFAEDQYRDVRASKSIADTVFRHVQHGRAYHVAPNMVDMIVNRAEHPEHFSGIEPIGSFTQPFNIGFCVLGEPLKTVEVRGRQQKTVAFSWGPADARYLDSGKTTVTPGVFLTEWSNAYLAPDEVHAWAMSQDPEYIDAIRLVGGWAPIVMDFIPLDAKIGPPRIDVPYEKRQLAVIEGWEWNRDGTSNYARLLAALWELMSETLSTAHTERLDRATFRFAKRAKIDTDVTVITLRREARETMHPGSGTPLQYRVPVNGHPRTYHRGAPDEFTIWINDHERGPKDAPYRANRKVYSLVR